MYGSTSYLFYKNNIINNERGVHQGGPLSSLLYSLAQNLISGEIKNKNINLALNTFYLDDGVFIGDLDESSNFLVFIFLQ